MSSENQPVIESLEVVPTYEDHNGIFFAIDVGNVNMCADIILKDPDNVKVKGLDGITPLHNTCMKGNIEIVQLLLDNGADANARTVLGETPLHYACQWGDVRIIHKLIAASADWTAVDKMGRNCMHFTAMGGSVTSMHYLSTQTGLSYGSTDNNGDSPLHISCAHQHTAMVDYLLRKSRCNPHKGNHQGTTPLHIAAKVGNTDLMWKVMQAAGCSALRSKDGEGNSPVDVAKRELTDRQSSVISTLEYYSKQVPLSFPKGPVWTWWTLFLLPVTWSSLVFVLSSLMVGYAGFFAVFMFGLLVMFVSRQSPRIRHIAKWQNPIFLGSFAGGVIHCIVAYLMIIYYFWPCYNIFFVVTFISTTCLYSLYHLTMGNPHQPERIDGKQYTVLDIALGRCKNLYFCPITEVVSSEESKYCRLCEKSVVGFDHHCVFLMKCVTMSNRRLFVVFILNIMLMQILFFEYIYMFMITAYPSSLDWFVKDMFLNEGRLFDLMVLYILAFIWECSLIFAQLYNISMGKTTYHQRVARPTFPTMLRNVGTFFLNPSTYFESLNSYERIP